MAVGTLPLGAQESLIYKDVSVDFTWEEWMQLCSAQRNLYGRVMLENWSVLVSLGHQPSKPNVISDLEQELTLRKGEFPGCISLGRESRLETRQLQSPPLLKICPMGS